jgi:nucleotide-binding universal stress UspA family protein
MPTTILVPLDGSPLAEQALPYGQRFASAGSSRLVLMRAAEASWVPGHHPAITEAEATGNAQAYLGKVAAGLAAAGHEVETIARCGEPAREILAQAVSADLVVMATHGRSGAGRWIYGSVADEVLRHTPVPVVIVPRDAAPPWPTDRAPRILATLDGSATSEAVLDPLLKLATLLRANVILLQVVDWPPVTLTPDNGARVGLPSEKERATREYLERAADPLRTSMVSVRVRAEVGRTPAAIVHLAEVESADLIAMATHGRGGLARLVLGSTATATMQRSHIPLLLVRALPSTVSETRSGGAAATETVVSVTLSRADLALLDLGLTHMLYGAGADPSEAQAIADLSRRLKTFEASFPSTRQVGA